MGALIDGARLVNTDLRGANLSKASFRDALFMGTKLQGALVLNTDFRDAQYLGAGTLRAATGASDSILDRDIRAQLAESGDEVPPIANL